ncbi:MAG: inositol monophosphatase family protein [Acidimicrobiales bacterium]
MSEDLSIALRCSNRAAELALSYFEPDVAVSLKADGTPVTAADQAVEQLLRDLLSSEAPGDALLGEEFGRLGESDRLWILDPIDGTSFFGRHDPNWRVHMALEVAGETEVAVVTAPALGRQWWATRGGGAFEATWPSIGDEKRLSVSQTVAVEESIVGALDEESRLRLPPLTTAAPPSPLPLVELLRGQIDAFLVEGFHVWDHSPWILLIEEAGGKFMDRSGGRSGYAGGGLYSNRFLHSELVAAVGYEPKR